MAKRSQRAGNTGEGQGVEAGSTATESAVEHWTEDLGRLLGTARAKAEGWLDQRHAVAKQLEQIRDTASGLLNQLTGMPRRGRPGRVRTAQPMGTLPNPRPKRTLSAKARRAISLAQKRRWAKVRAEK